MTKDKLYEAALTTKASTPVDYFFARFFGTKAVIEFEERRCKSKRKNSALVTINHSFVLSQYNGKTYLLDKRVVNRRKV